MPSFLSAEAIYSNSASRSLHPPTSKRGRERKTALEMYQAIIEQTAYPDGFISLIENFNHADLKDSLTISPLC